MLFDKKKKGAEETPEFQDPLSGTSFEKIGANGRPVTEKKKKWFQKDDDVVRMDDLERILDDEDEIDVDSVVSMYMPHRRLKQLANAFLRLDRVRQMLLVAILIVAILFIMAFMQEKMGNFTINLNRIELYRKGIAIDTDGEFSNPTARLTATAVENATNITLTDLPLNIDDVNGDHNGLNYMAYTYYVRNAGKVDVGYIAEIDMDNSTKGAYQAVRVAVWKNGERMIYASPSANGDPEPGCVNFLDSKVVCQYVEDKFLVGNVDKYTIVIWTEGEDPECVDAIVGGSLQFSMHIDAMEQEDTSLLVKFIQDIKDTLSGDKPIGAAGTDAPEYAWGSGNVTYSNRRNQ